MFKKCLIYVTPHNWYDHVLTGQINRPLKLAEQFYNHKLFSEMMIVNRLRPSRITRVNETGRELIFRRGLFNVFFDPKNEVYYLEHCLPFGIIEELILPIIVKYVMRKLNFYNGLLWICDPKSMGLSLKFDKMEHLFDAYDDWSLSPFYKKRKRNMKFITRGYQIAKKSNSLIITNTKHMKNKLATYSNSNRVELIGNTSSLNVNLGRMDKEHTLQKGNHKVVGYVGNIHERIDLDLVSKMVGYFKNVKFVFIGRNDFESDRFGKLLEKYQNIEFLGQKAYDLIPNYIAQFDVCIVPHIVNEYTMSQDSMKMYDYLLCGKPVVTTEIPPADRLSKIMYVSHTPDDFIEQLSSALEENDDKLKNERLVYMKNNTWEKKAKQICALLED
ncbi:glycosyltransferase [Sporolactobacillus terrae]|uniref:glycosyltransferase n=1 Tax=Sporolactobacillus terrae TaxID=269673 RepID=UPI00048C27C1|nr:glycosyltransferase [Sporolactobacillus terrae]